MMAPEMKKLLREGPEMENKKGIQALDDSVLDSVTGGIETIADTQDVSDEIRLNLFGGEDKSGLVVQRSTLEKLIDLLWKR